MEVPMAKPFQSEEWQILRGIAKMASHGRRFLGGKMIRPNKVFTRLFDYPCKVPLYETNCVTYREFNSDVKSTIFSCKTRILSLSARFTALSSSILAERSAFRLEICADFSSRREFSRLVPSNVRSVSDKLFSNSSICDVTERTVINNHDNSKGLIGARRENF
uniref:Uncharacterized protein n=1 Tax=Romanomermis culicivorax TaxID=13658 RepID=A0A915K833_ROMCU